MELTTLGGGCFWCIEAIFEEIDGVQKVESGYSGGISSNPTYEQVCTGETGHAEVIQITFNPEMISFADIVEIFFTFHDPTTLNRQGNDIGTQYRSIILYHDYEQRTIAEMVIEKVTSSKVWDRPIVTELKPFETFFKAEDYHQDYFKNNPLQGYCRAIIAPKVSKFRELYGDRLRK